MKPLKVCLLATAVTVAYFPISAGAFGFGASRYEYGPPPWEYGPYGGYPPQGSSPQGPARPNARPYGPSPYGPPPNARNVTGMWGSGPGMSWGPRDPEADRAERAKRLEHYRNPWIWTKDWTYESPYKDDAPPSEAPSK
jgi:hypothetical protein